MLKDFPDLLKNKGGYLLRGGYLLAIGLIVFEFLPLSRPFKKRMPRNP